MANKIWLGNAKEVAQIDYITPGNVEIGDTFTLTINGKSCSFVATAATVANVTAGLVAAAQALGLVEREYAEVTWTDATTCITATGPADGTPVTIATGTTNKGGGVNNQTLVLANNTPAAGPNHFDVAANWSTGSIPADDDVLIFENSDVSCLYGLSQTSITPDKVIVRLSYTGDIGLPQHTGFYRQYRPTELTLGTHGDGGLPLITIEVGSGIGSGSRLLRFNTGSKKTKLTVLGTAASKEAGAPTLCWRGTHADNVVEIYQGSLGVAAFLGQTATVATLHVAYVNSVERDASVSVGADVTLGAVIKTGGVLTLDCGCTSLEQQAGETSISGTGSLANLELLGGALYSTTTGVLGKYGAITGITKANPAVVTDVAHGLATGDKIRIAGIGGMTEVNQREFTVHVLTADTFELVGEDSSGYGAYASPGSWGKLGSVVVAGRGVLDFSGDLESRQVAAAIEVFGDEAQVKDEAQRISTLTYLTGEFAVWWRHTTRYQNFGRDYIEVRRLPA